MKAINRWNHKVYTVVKVTDTTVTLKREDDSIFSVSKAEYLFSYVEK